MLNSIFYKKVVGNHDIFQKSKTYSSDLL